MELEKPGQAYKYEAFDPMEKARASTEKARMQLGSLAFLEWADRRLCEARARIARADWRQHCERQCQRMSGRLSKQALQRSMQQQQWGQQHPSTFMYFNLHMGDGT